MAVAAAAFTLQALLALPGVVLALVVGALRYGVPLDVQPAIVPAVLLTALMAASVGFALGHVVPNAQAVTLVSNMVVFFVLLFSPVAFPVTQFPIWLQAVNQWLPFAHMAHVVPAALAPTLVPDGVTSDYLVLAARRTLWSRIPEATNPRPSDIRST
jgi:ABC-2 type transport system permease protein